MSISSSFDVEYPPTMEFCLSQPDLALRAPPKCKPIITIAETRSKRKARLALSRYLSPIYSLPSEMLSSIFTEYCPMPVDPDKQHIPQLVLTQVCSTWRQVAHGTPRLWSRFQALYGSNGITVHGDKIFTWLNRSGEVPLDIAIRPKDTIFSPPSDILGCMNSFCHRIRTLNLAIPLHVLLHLNLLPGFPSLTVLNIRLIKNELIDSAPTKIKAKDTRLTESECQQLSLLRNSPRLTELWFVGPELSGEMIPEVLSLLLPVSQLRILHLIVAAETCHILMDPLAYLKILMGSCASLEHCALRCPQWIPGVIVPNITFPSLGTLDLLDWHDECESRFLSAITVPALRSFRTNHIYHGGFVNGGFASDMMELQKRSSASLRSLDLVGMHELSVDDILSMLAVLPALRTLGLNHCDLDTTSLMQGLEYREGERLLVPELRSFSFKNSQLGPKGSDRYIADMVESRNSTGNDDEQIRPAKLRRISKLTVIFEKQLLTQAVTRRLKNSVGDLDLGENLRKKRV
ncbi:hypothetical protein J3R30DRAFT_3710090 [Lentinula aciculospora]|uniref:F-box domain-containing protein n=1 Tax=Lentinula aciculospora TaxID=153920 RepID=A0A9W9A1Q8_9AGAR|nr:hypothetical protein J3R30DRAFT_3710090 [Lentinula aciculospora]